MHIDEDLRRWWTEPGEVVRVATDASRRNVGSRVAGRVRVPHPVPAGAEETTGIDRSYPDPSSFTTAGRFAANEWADDDTLSWWAQAADPDRDAVRAADALAIGLGETGIAITTRRFAVLLPAKFLVSRQEELRTARREKGLLRQAASHVNDFIGRGSWLVGDRVVSVWEIEVERVLGWSPVLIGRGFPFARVLRVDFVDGSVLYGRTGPRDLIE
ncbi:hypothetical protein [Actinokineospora sp. NBRC 105648]|uniref:hypothetical protein n=1 Tax=Actinokineospora sp. NBRC 105648 TaxID=3032206 RepID=UPI0024A5199D|nr:hypothetical protein [Actinokineospora sp. NBRC 105648]GLZ40651.1 hypothetical protein Acsp05_42750 [Actinokineospora sp. NBRC 105648]